MKTITVINSNIKAYHIFKVKPHPDIGMNVEKDVLNGYDPNAMIIKMPRIEEISLELHDSVTKEAKNGIGQQTVTDIAGCTVGRVPANVWKLFHDMLSEGEVKEIMCWPMEKPTLSTVPASHQSFNGICMEEKIVEVVELLFPANLC